MGIYSIATVSLNLTNGYTGLFLLGMLHLWRSVPILLPCWLFHSIWGVIRTSTFTRFLDWCRWSHAFIVALIAGGVFAALSAILIGAPVLRWALSLSCFIGFHGHSDHLCQNLKDHPGSMESMPYLLIPISIGPIYGSSSQYMWFGE